MRECPLISVLLPTYNCERIVRNTLESVKWAAEILVVDSYSTDGTLEICREYGARIIQHRYLNSAKQKNWAIPQCKHDWVLQIDTDEVLEAALIDEIEAALVSSANDYDGFRMPFKHHILNRSSRTHKSCRSSWNPETPFSPLWNAEYFQTA
jgi:glycosyltransferase involved in cell wall biosynthesis